VDCSPSLCLVFVLGRRLRAWPLLQQFRCFGIQYFQALSPGFFRGGCKLSHNWTTVARSLAVCSALYPFDYSFVSFEPKFAAHTHRFFNATGFFSALRDPFTDAPFLPRMPFVWSTSLFWIPCLSSRSPLSFPFSLPFVYPADGTALYVFEPSLHFRSFPHPTRPIPRF